MLPNGLGKADLGGGRCARAGGYGAFPRTSRDASARATQVTAPGPIPLVNSMPLTHLDVSAAGLCCTWTTGAEGVQSGCTALSSTEPATDPREGIHRRVVRVGEG